MTQRRSFLLSPSLRAGISLFMALVLGSLSILFALLFVMAEAKRLQPLSEEALLRQSEVLLASYDRSLMERYAIPGLQPSEFTDELPQLMWLMAPHRHQNLETQLSWCDGFTHSESLRRLILDQMVLRFPAELLKQIYAHMKGLARGSELSTDVAGLRGPRGPWLGSTPAQCLSGDPFEAFLSYLEGVASEEAVLSELLDPASDFSTSDDEELRELQAKMQELRREKNAAEADVRLELGGGAGPPPLDQFSRVHAYLRDFWDKVTRGIVLGYESLCLREYFVAFLSSEIRHQGRQIPETNPFSSNQSPRLWSYHEMTFSSDHELERLLTGISQDYLAYSLVRAELFGLRFLFNGVSFYNDGARMAGYRLGNWWQQLIAAIISFFGIDPVSANEVVVLLRLLIDAAKQSSKDVRTLCRGEVVPLFYGPLGHIGVDLDYLHYLRFLLLFQSDDVLLQRFVPILEANTGGSDYQLSFELDLELQSRFHSIHKTRRGSFLDEPPERAFVVSEEGGTGDG